VFVSRAKRDREILHLFLLARKNPETHDRTRFLRRTSRGFYERIIIPCYVGFKTGEWLIVLGACGNGATLRHSYAGTSGAFQSNVLSSAITLYRGGTQANIITAPTPHAVWNEILGVICRVEVYVTAGSAAKIIGQGSGLPGSTYTCSLVSAEEPGLAYHVGSSFGNGPDSDRHPPAGPRP
jgi:hypothetical protein